MNIINSNQVQVLFSKDEFSQTTQSDVIIYTIIYKQSFSTVVGAAELILTISLCWELKSFICLMSAVSHMFVFFCKPFQIWVSE